MFDLKLSFLPMPLRRLLAGAYLLLALAAPLLVWLFPGLPPLSVNEPLLSVEAGRFVDHGAALGEGAEQYQVDVLSDMAGIVASAAADYPDGGNALLARFDSRETAQQAADKLIEMIPHATQERDLWGRHISADSGDHVLLAGSDTLLVLIIAESETAARKRLAALPALNLNTRPGLGAVLAQQPASINLLLLMFYAAVQWLLLRLLLAWSGIMPASQTKG